MYSHLLGTELVPQGALGYTEIVFALKTIPFTGKEEKKKRQPQTLKVYL